MCSDKCSSTVRSACIVLYDSGIVGSLKMAKRILMLVSGYDQLENGPLFF